MKSFSTENRFIVIEGNIGAGKTSLVEKITRDNRFFPLLEEFTENPFLPLFYRNPIRYAFPLECFFLTERYKQIQTEFQIAQADGKKIIADYAFVKTLIFAQNNLTDLELELFHVMFHALADKMPKPDLYVYLKRPVEHLLNNIANRGRNFETLIDEQYLVRIDKQYMEFIESDKTMTKLVIDLGDADFINNENCYEELLELLCPKFENQFNNINF